jgi:hypothetical protein
MAANDHLDGQPPSGVHTHKWLYATVIVAGAAAFFAASTRSQALASAWNRATSFAKPGLKLRHRRYMLHAPHRLGIPGHQGRWHWEVQTPGRLPIRHRRTLRVWQPFKY